MNVLIVGLGSIGGKHLDALDKLGLPFTVYALRSTVNAPVAKNVLNIYWLDELRGISVDFAIISNPTSEHIGTIRTLLALNCPLFIEKPLFHRLAITKEIE